MTFISYPTGETNSFPWIHMWKPAEADSFVYDLEGPTGIQESCTGHEIGRQSFGKYSDGLALVGLKESLDHPN